MNGTDEFDGTRAPTVAEALAMAEAWNERAALLATLAYEVLSLFGSSGEDRPAPYLVQRIAGGATAVNPQVIDDVRAELFSAAEGARQEARRILGSTTEAPVDGRAPCLNGRGDIAPSVDSATMKVPSGGDEIVSNPECPQARRALGTGRRAFELDQEAEQRRVPTQPEREAKKRRRTSQSAGATVAVLHRRG